jgi:hypothetical protein
MTVKCQVEFIKDPDARLDYQWDWSGWLAAGDVIASHEIIVDQGDVTFDTDSHDDQTVTAWIEGGTIGTRAKVTARITTAQGRVDDRTIGLKIQER